MPGPDPLTTEWVPIWNTTGPLYTVEDEGVGLPVRTVLNFTGPGVIASDVGGKTTITITGTPQTPWLSPIDAAGFPLSGIPDITFHYAGVKAGQISSFIFEGNGALEFYTYDATDGHLAIHAAVSGHVGIAGAASATHNLEVTGTLNLMGGPYYLNGVPLALGQPQTPWAQDINGGNFNLSNVAAITTNGKIIVGEDLYITNTAGDAGVTYRLDGYTDVLHIIATPSAAAGAGMRLMTGPAAGGIGLGIEILPSGRVGIGKAPITGHSSLLQVNGPITATQIGTTNCFVHLGDWPHQGPSGDSAISVQFNTTYMCGWISAVTTGVAWRDIDICADAGNLGVNKIPAYRLDVNGDCNITGAYRVNGVPLATGGQPQTPWAQPINGNGQSLSNVYPLTVGPFPVSSRPNNYLLCIVGNPSGAAAARQIEVGEASNNPDYRMNVGFSIMNGSWAGVMNSVAGGAGANLYINGLGGWVAVGHEASPFAPVSTGPILGTIKLATYDGGAGILYGIGVQSGVLTFGAQIAQNGNAHMTLNTSGNLGIGIGNAGSAHRLTVIPAAGVNTFALASQQVKIGEPSNIAGYALTIGYGAPSGRYGGMIQAWDNGAVGTLYLNPSGGNIVMANSASWGADTANMPLGTMMIYYNHTNSYLYFYIKRTDTQTIRSAAFLCS